MGQGESENRVCSPHPKHECSLIVLHTSSVRTCYATADPEVREIYRRKCYFRGVAKPETERARNRPITKKDFRANSVLRCPDLRDVRFNRLFPYQELCHQQILTKESLLSHRYIREREKIPIEDQSSIDS